MSLSVNPNTVRDSSLVLDIDPANENTFRGPTTTNQITDSTPWAVYNNYGANITTTLTKTADTYRGFPVYVETITPQNPTTASQISGGGNGGLGIFTTNNTGGGLANRYTGYSIYFRANKPLHSNPIYTYFANAAGFLPEYNNAFEDMGDGWYRAYTIFYSTTTAVDQKFWAINAASIASGETMTVWWAGPFKEDRNDQSYISPAVDGTRGTTVALNGGVIDASGTNNNGTLTGDIRFNTANRGAWSFSGNTANFISIPDNDSLSFLGNTFTLDFWVRINAGENNLGILGKRNPWEYSVYADGSSLIFNTWNPAGSGVYFHSLPVTNDQWVHYCQSANGTVSNLYVNGVFHSASIKSGLTMGNGSSPLDIGTGGAGEGLRPMKGRIGPVKIYNRALTQAEVVQNFNAIRGRYSI